VFVIEKNYRLQDIQLSKNPPPPLRGFGEASRPRATHQVVVENTGLEPVTSWLQTRRSPS
jgi:hypothetical protein